MGFQDLAYGGVTLAVALLTALMGGIFLLLAWTDHFRAGDVLHGDSRPVALIALSMGVFVEASIFLTNMALQRNVTGYEIAGIRSDSLVCIAQLAVGFMFLATSFVLALRNRGRRQRFVLLGSILLLAINGLGGAIMVREWLQFRL